jgi:hypothetical protein
LEVRFWGRRLHRHRHDILQVLRMRLDGAPVWRPMITAHVAGIIPEVGHRIEMSRLELMSPCVIRPLGVWLPTGKFIG